MLILKIVHYNDNDHDNDDDDETYGSDSPGRGKWSKCGIF